MRIPVCLLFSIALLATPLVASLLFASVSFASVPFDSGVSIQGINGAVGVVAGDLNGDGIADVAGLGGGRVVYLQNNGDATAWTGTNLVSSGPWVRQIELADLDGDTDLDVIYTDFDEDRVYWFRNDLDTSGSFSSRRTVGDTIDGADGLFAVDLDGDLDVDLLATARAGDAYYWFENDDSSGTSWTTHLVAGALDAPQTVTAGDLDGDGDLDLVGGGAEAGGSTIWIENTLGDASEWSVRTIDGTAWINSVVATDLDLDGDLDVVLQENNAAPPASDADVVIWWENSNGDASAWIEHEIGPAGKDATRGLQVVDLDFDGDPDVVANRNGDWFENTAGNASAWTQHSFSDGDEIADTDVRDLDGDGDLDVLGARQEKDRIEWWENLTCALTDADDDSDGYRNDCDVCPGFDDALDSDGDGVPDGCDQCPGEDDRVDVDDEGTPDACQMVGSLSINDVTLSEGDVGITDFTFTVTLTGDLPAPLTIGYTTSDGTATAADGDYAAGVGTLSFDGHDGEAETFTVSVTGDHKVEGDETFTVQLGAPSSSSATVDDGIGIGTIEGDDSAALSISDVTAAEGDVGAVDFIFTVTLDGNVQGGFTVGASTQDGTATAAAGDYAGTTGTLSFDGTDGETELFMVNIAGDTSVESDELFSVLLGTPSNGRVTVADGTGIGTIQNDDTASIAIDDVTAMEGNSGTTELTFTITLTGAVQDGFTVDANTMDGTATVTSGDFATAAETLSFTGTHGETQTITVDLAGDTVVEADETLLVELGSPSSADISVADGIGIGTIENDDSTSISVDDVSIVEGESGTSNLTFTVTLSGAVQGGFTVNVSTQDGSATAASGDYGSSSGALTFTGIGGETQVFTVAVNGDTTVEADETFTVLLGTPSNADVIAADGAGLGTVQNDDTASLSIADAGVIEGDSGTTDLAFAVTLTGTVQDGFTVNAFTQDSSATTADGDYGAAVDILSFTGADGEIQNIEIGVLGDLRVEQDESFFVLLASPSNSNVGIADGTAVGTIENDDNATLSIADVTATEGDSGTTSFSFEVTLSGTVDSSFLVGYGTRDGSATAAGGDYDSAAGFLSFAGNSGETQTAGISVRGDTSDELDELFFVDLTSSTNPTVTFSTGTAQGTILDDDATLTVIVEGQGNVSSSPSGIDCGDGGLDCVQVYPAGTTVDLTPTPATDWVFLGWSGDTDCTDGSITLDDTTSCTATFAESGGLLVIDFNGDGFGSVISTPAGIDCDRADPEAGCAALFDVGVDIDLTATAAPVDTFFDGWTGDADCEDGLVTFLADGEMVICVANIFAIPLFADGFESGNASAWTSTAPLLP